MIYSKTSKSLAYTETQLHWHGKQKQEFTNTSTSNPGAFTQENKFSQEKKSNLIMSGFHFSHQKSHIFDDIQICKYLIPLKNKR